MRFAFDEDSLLFQSTLRDFLAAECTPEVVRASWEAERGAAPGLWKQLAELGIPGVQVPEAHEGLGLDEVTLVLLMEELGRAACPEPLVATAAVGVPLLVELGDEAMAARWLPRVARGETILAVGHPDLPFVTDADRADLLLLPDGDALVALEADGLRCTAQPANDPSRRLFSVAWERGAAQRVAEGDRAAALLAGAFDRGALASAAQALGVADRLVTLSVEYTSQRRQFGVPIGSFQAVKHHLANVKVALEYARPVVQRAAHSVATAAPERALHVSMAKSAACEAAALAARSALQVHGAIGYTWEQDLHIWMRRAWSLDHAFGERAFHEARIADTVLSGAVRIGAGTTFSGED